MLFDKDLKSDFQTQRIASDVLDPHRFDEIDRHDTVVKLKWRGTSQDKLDMATIGRHQTLRVRGSHCTYKSLEICPDESSSGISILMSARYQALEACSSAPRGSYLRGYFQVRPLA